MRTPHRTATHPDADSDTDSDTDPYADPDTDPHTNTRPNTYTNPYDELGALDDGPLEVLPLDEFLRVEEPEPVEDWAPPNHRRRGARRRRRRFAGLPLAMKAVVGVLVLAAFLTLADRWALLYAEQRAAGALQDRLGLSAAPEVEIDGFPFLTQLGDSRLDSVKLTVPDVAADRVSLAKVSATATGVRINGGPTSPRGARIPELHGEVLLAFDDLDRELGASQVRFRGEGRDRVLARGTLPVAGHDLRLRAQARIERDGARGIATRIGGMRLDIGDVATYRPGTRPSEGLHLSRRSAARLAHETAKAKALLSVPSIVRALRVPDAAVRAALSDDTKLAELTGSDRFARQAMGLNLIDVAAAHPELLKRFGLDPALLDGLSRLTRPVLVDRLSFGFRLPQPEHGDLWLRDVRVMKDGIRVRLVGSGLRVGKS
ncbi:MULTISPECIES: LmeA family phospholipid-binding protein [Streptomyces]|uniref:DUF2993 domain-containing protein n=1 Tax=Streptomyces avermitilis TaxID=33903 RepID=A0A4D4MWG2_STRAX|nr:MULTISPECIES: DUF2993 domain-containing protein [Streptomyces]MYS99646.1 LmeA family phospholipid-binding protein [Streptomyces sp. SID5469]BBJ52024.1 hypothetical protein SAVMC3_46530 [Streptomyces avermitilis]GDY64057.1 hypothetical protein SAV14893_034500 [Streptomyces avermitilis]GDY75785.1 hypothetical protein SAV31267_052700 [Streptomyces avermitilis]GDY84756.1 hypothetical protein SAVCW2_39550 [Streptomyces avermitilis]